MLGRPSTHPSAKARNQLTAVCCCHQLSPSGGVSKRICGSLGCLYIQIKYDEFTSSNLSYISNCIVRRSVFPFILFCKIGKIFRLLWLSARWINSLRFSYNMLELNTVTLFYIFECRLKDYKSVPHQFPVRITNRSGSIVWTKGETWMHVFSLHILVF
jgi:hypothetical protein